MHQCKICKSLKHSEDNHPCNFDECKIKNANGITGLGHSYHEHECNYCKSQDHVTKDHKCRHCGKLGHDSDKHSCSEWNCSCDSIQCLFCDEIHCTSRHKCTECDFIGHQCENFGAREPKNLEEALKDICRLRRNITNIYNNFVVLNDRLTELEKSRSGHDK